MTLAGVPSRRRRRRPAGIGFANAARRRERVSPDPGDGRPVGASAPNGTESVPLRAFGKNDENGEKYGTFFIFSERSKHGGRAMLVLSRKLGESIVIGDDVVVTVRQLRNGQVRLSVKAPRSVPVLRQELLSSPRAAVCAPAEVRRDG
jgi:carbon storage regulator